MSTEHSIQILLSHNIDKEKWNACLRTADNAVIYAWFEYLQYMADNWAGIIVDDYKAIMPLPFRIKMGVRYYYHVPFVQQLGLFGTFDELILKAIIQEATRYIRYGDLFFNYRNNLSRMLPQARMSENYVLNLSSSYESIYANYNKHLQTKLKKAKASFLLLKENADISKTVFLFSQLYPVALPNVKADNYNRLIQAAKYFSGLKQCFNYAVSDRKDNILAMALFFKDEKRIYNILPSTTQEGRKLNAMHFLLDGLIQSYAETQYSLDFEGSDVPGIKQFYQSFGAINQPYFHYHFNRLPIPIRWLKK